MSMSTIYFVAQPVRTFKLFWRPWLAVI